MFEGQIREACAALASLASDAGRLASGPHERASLLLEATTCDETLPPAFLSAARRALAVERVEEARLGGAIEVALDALSGLAGERRHAAVAELAGLAEDRGDRGLALRALLLLPLSELGPALRREGAPALLTAPWPRLDYPRLPAPPVGDDGSRG